ncbi:MAG: glycosyltransferase family 4 protein [Hyphomicrobium sp.]
MASFFLFAINLLRKRNLRLKQSLESPKEQVSQRRSRAEFRRANWSLVRDALVDEVSKHDPFDAIHSHDIIALEAGALLKERYGSKLIWDAHEIYESLGDVDASALSKNVILENKNVIDSFITINESIAGFYEQSHPELPTPAIVMNATLPSEPVKDDGRLRAAAELPEGSKIVLFQGGFAKHRGLEALVAAARDFDPPWFLVMMGWGHLEDKLRAAAEPINEQARADGLPDRVVFLPGAPNSELKYWTAGATLGAIPYENANLNHLYCTPNKLWEYPVAGVPFIATDLEEMSKMVKAYDTGFLIPRDFTAKSISDIVNAITEEVLEQKRAACARFSREHNWSRFEPRLLAVYETLGAEEELLRAVT